MDPDQKALLELEPKCKRALDQIAQLLAGLRGVDLPLALPVLRELVLAGVSYERKRHAAPWDDDLTPTMGETESRSSPVASERDFRAPHRKRGT